MVRDVPSAFADEVVKLLRDREKRARLGRAARRRVVEQYSWTVVAKPLLERYKAIVDASRSNEGVVTSERGGVVA